MTRLAETPNDKRLCLNKTSNINNNGKDIAKENGFHYHNLFLFLNLILQKIAYNTGRVHCKFLPFRELPS